MIYLTAVNDIGIGSGFDNTMRKRTPFSTHPAWGITELLHSTFSRINKNDYVMFYHKGLIIGVGVVKDTSVDQDLSAKLWGTYQHRFKGTLHWSCIIYFDKYFDIDMPFNVLRALGEYDTKFSVRRMVQLNSTGVQAIERDYGGEAAYVSKLIETYGSKL